MGKTQLRTSPIHGFCGSPAYLTFFADSWSARFGSSTADGRERLLGVVSVDVDAGQVVQSEPDLHDAALVEQGLELRIFEGLAVSEQRERRLREQQQPEEHRAEPQRRQRPAERAATPRKPVVGV